MKNLAFLIILPLLLISCASTDCGWKECDGGKTYCVFPPEYLGKKCYTEGEVEAYTTAVPKEIATMVSSKKPAYSHHKFWKKLRYWETARVHRKTRYGHHWYTASGQYLFTSWEPLAETCRRRMNI